VVSTEGPRLNQIRIYRPELTLPNPSNLDLDNSFPPDLALHDLERDSSTATSDFDGNESSLSSSESLDFDLEEEEFLLSSSPHFDFYEEEEENQDQARDEDEEQLPSSPPDLGLEDDSN
jgi:hypothetical protein